MLNDQDSALDDASPRDAFPALQQRTSASGDTYWRERSRAEREWRAGWQVRMRQALQIQREQMGK